MKLLGVRILVVRRMHLVPVLLDTRLVSTTMYRIGIVRVTSALTITS